MTINSVGPALVRVMAELPGMGKDDRSPEGYAYRGIDSITKRLQPLLAKHGVVILPDVTVIQVVPSPAMKDGWQDVRVSVTWTIIGPEGDQVQATTAGIGRDRSDKGSNKAQTQAYKYLLLHLFCISDKADDSDNLTYVEGHADSLITSAQCQTIADLFSDLPTDERRTIKRRFITQFGALDKIKSDRVDDAIEWVDNQIADAMQAGLEADAIESILDTAEDVTTFWVDAS